MQEGGLHSCILEAIPGHLEASLSADATVADRRVLLPIDEVAELTGVSEATLRRSAPIRRIGCRTLIPRAWLEHIASWPKPDATEVS
jgi:hypothetical protein